MNADTTSKCAYLFEFLKKSGVQSLEMVFSGGNLDHGDIVASQAFEDSFWDQLTIFSVRWSEDNFVKMRLDELLFEVTEGILSHHDVDYENGQGRDGARGNVLFDIENGKITTSYQVHTATEKEETLYI